MKVIKMENTSGRFFMNDYLKKPLFATAVKARNFYCSCDVDDDDDVIGTYVSCDNQLSCRCSSTC